MSLDRSSTAGSPAIARHAVVVKPCPPVEPSGPEGGADAQGDDLHVVMPVVAAGRVFGRELDRAVDVVGAGWILLGLYLFANAYWPSTCRPHDVLQIYTCSGMLAEGEPEIITVTQEEEAPVATEDAQR